jgi:uncharacterized protein YjbK
VTDCSLQTWVDTEIRPIRNEAYSAKADFARLHTALEAEKQQQMRENKYFAQLNYKLNEQRTGLLCEVARDKQSLVDLKLRSPATCEVVEQQRQSYQWRIETSVRMKHADLKMSLESLVQGNNDTSTSAQDCDDYPSDTR